MALARIAYFDEGMKHASAGRHEYAAFYLRQAAHDEPNNPYVHYYLANSLVYLHKHDEAVREYMASYRLDPFGPVSGYCRRALMAYKTKLPDVDFNSPPSSIVPPPPISHENEEIVSAIDLIRRQAEEEKRKHRHSSDAFSIQAQRTSNWQARKIEEDARARIDDIYSSAASARIYNPFAHSPEALQARADEVRRQASEDAKLMRQRAEERIEDYKRVAKDREDLLDESAANLEGQLHTKALAGGSRLSGMGTGLYVRSYDRTVPKSNYPEAHESVARIRPAGEASETPSTSASGTESADRGGKESKDTAKPNSDRAVEKSFKELIAPIESVRGSLVR